MLGELYSAAFTAPGFNWLCSPAVTELETIVLDWLSRLFNLPPCFYSNGEGGGVIQGSASEAIVTVMVAARERCFKRVCEGLDGEAREAKISSLRSRLVALGSDQSHSSTQKAALILGVHYKAVPTTMEDNLSISGEHLIQTLGECEREGLEPFYLTTTLGTTSTCAIDYFQEIKQVLRQDIQPAPEIWIHVDAAYAGAALVCEEYHHLTKSFDAFDSFEMNMHKWLLVNFDAGCLWVKNRTDLTSALSITPSYLRNDFSDSGLVTDYRDWQIPLGRRFRSLKIWFVLRSYGVSGLKSYIRNHIRLGMGFHDWVLSRPDLFEILTRPAFALTVLTIKPGAAGQEADIPFENAVSHLGPEERKVATASILEYEDRQLQRANATTKRVYEAINAAGEIFLTSSVIKGVYAIRVVSGNENSDEQHLRKAFDILVRTTLEIRGEAEVKQANGLWSGRAGNVD
ncbi:MAG: hypothetical protein Q9195_004017 [Heterodermia aff. obscurata]